MLTTFVLLPLGIATVLSLCRSFSERFHDLVVTATLLTLALMSGAALADVQSQGMLLQALGKWSSFPSLSLVLDGFSAFMLVIVNTLLFLLGLYSIGYMSGNRQKRTYYVLFLLSLAGLNGVLLAADLFNLFVFTELTVMTAYIFASFNARAENFEASFKYTVMGSLSSMLILFAIALLYAKTSSFNLSTIAAAHIYRGSFFDALVLILLIVGFGLKSTLVPFHAWVPDAYTSAPAPATALFAGAISKVAGIYVLMRLSYNVIGVTPALLHVLSLLGVFSILVGVTLALYQWDFKRLLAYHSISQIGYIVLGLGLGTPLGILGGLFHLLNHSVFKSLLFLNAGSVERSTGTRDLHELGGLAQKMPVTGTTSFIASMAISGVPPLNGFWSKLLIVIACVQSGHYWYGLFAALASILTLASFLKVQRYAFFGYLKDAFKEIKESPETMTVPMITLAALCIMLGVLLIPGVDNSFLKLASNTLLAGRDYAATFRVLP